MMYAKDYVSKTLYDSDPFEAVYGILQMIASNPKIDDLTLSAMNRPAFYGQLFLNYQGEVGNGGHWQFFWNPYADFTGQTLLGLEEIGLQNYQDILMRACAVFDKGVVIQTLEKRRMFVESVSQKQNRLWAGLDNEMYGIDIDVSFKSVQNYFISHWDEIRPDTEFENPLFSTD